MILSTAPPPAPPSARRVPRVRALAAAALLGLGLLAAPFAPAAATSTADATGCSGSAVSFDADGQPVDTVKAPGAGGTEESPFVIALDGSVAWKGSTSTVLRDGTWRVSVAGVPVRSGDVANDEGTRAKAGETDLSSLPGFVTMWLDGGTVVPVAADVSTKTGSCTALVYVSTATSPTFTPLWITGLALLVVGVLLLLLLLLRILAWVPEGATVLTGVPLDAPPPAAAPTASGGAS